MVVMVVLMMFMGFQPFRFQCVVPRMRSTRGIVLVAILKGAFMFLSDLCSSQKKRPLDLLKHLDLL